MFEPVSYEDAIELLATVVAILTAHLPEEFDNAPELNGLEIELDLRKVHHLCASMESEEFLRNKTSHERVAAAMLAIYKIQPYILPQEMSRNVARQIQALGAVFFAEVVANRLGLTLLDRVSDFQRLLCDTTLPVAQRDDAIRRLSNTAIYLTTSPLRPRPGRQAPIIYIGTPITKLTGREHRACLDVAELLAEVVSEFGYTPDVPGRYISPSKISTTDQHLRDRIADSSLTFSSGFVGVGTNIAGRGMGYAVRRMEDVGAPILLLSGEPEAFARVYGATLARRRQQVYDTLEEAKSHVFQFLSDFRDQIDGRHADLCTAHGQSQDGRLSDLSRILSRVDPAIFDRSRLLRARALHLVELPEHFMHAQPWEVREISRITGRSIADLMRLQYGLDATATPSPPRVQGRTRAHDLSVTPLAWQGFLAAKQLGGWADDRAMMVMNEYLSGASTELISTSRKVVEAQDWLDFHNERFA